LLLLAAACLWGCAWRGPMPAATLGDLDPGPRVMAFDQAAWKLVAAQNLAERRNNDGRLHVAVELVNLSTSDLDVGVRVVFLDEQGRLISQASPWEVVVIAGSSMLLYDAACLDTRAQTYRVEIRTP